MLKYLSLILFLLFVQLMSLAQTDTSDVKSKQITSVKNELDLDFEPLGVHISYKRKICNRVFIGYAAGGGFLPRILFNDFQVSLDLFRQKLFIDVELTKRFHIYEGVTYSSGIFNGYYDGLENGVILGIETGFFYRITKMLEIGFEPSIIFMPHNADIKSRFSIPMFTLRLPLIKWPKLKN